MTTGLPVESTRAHGWHRIAVSGRTREECLAHVDQVWRDMRPLSLRQDMAS